MIHSYVFCSMPCLQDCSVKHFPLLYRYVCLCAVNKYKYIFRQVFFKKLPAQIVHTRQLAENRKNAINDQSKLAKFSYNLSNYSYPLVGCFKFRACLAGRCLCSLGHDWLTANQTVTDYFRGNRKPTISSWQITAPNPWDDTQHEKCMTLILKENIKFEYKYFKNLIHLDFKNC